MKLVIGYWLLVIGYWLLVIGYWLLVIGYWLNKDIKQYYSVLSVKELMRITVFVLILTLYSFGQETKLNPKEIKDKVSFIQNHSAFSDALTYKDSTCSYLDNGVPYSGYVIHRFDNQYRFNLFEKGKYYGEEWIFDKTDSGNSDSLINNLKEFRMRCDTNQDLMIVTTYYDFRINSIHEVFIDYRYECALRGPVEPVPFDAIFGGDDLHKLPYKSFYRNGERKEVSEGAILNGKVIKYYENGKKATYRRASKNGDNGLIKEFDEEGKCVKRLKIRNNKIRGVYAILDGKIVPSFIIRHQLNKRKKKLNNSK